MNQTVTSIFFLLLMTFAAVKPACSQQTYNPVPINSLGLIVLRDGYAEKDTVTIYNADGSVWYKFSFYYDDSDGIFDYPKEDFAPYAFKPDYFLFVLEVTKADKNGFEVIVNSTTNLRKRVKKESFLKFQTWEEHVLSAFSIGFNSDINPIRKNPDVDSETETYNAKEIYYPVKTNGEWLQIAWGTAGNFSHGWIKWRDKKNLLIYLYYFA